MPLNLNGKQSCKVYFNGKEMCVGYMNGVKVFGCREEATVSDNTGALDSKVFTFGETSFTQNFTTDNPYTYDSVYLESLPEVKVLNLSGQEAVIGDNFKAVNSSGLKFVLGDRYATYGGTLYDFQENIDGIITRYEGLGYKLTENAGGVLTFTNLDNTADVVNVTGTEVSNSKLRFTFKVTDNSPLALTTNTATFSLVPQGDINLKPVYTNTPPIVGDNTVTMNRHDIWTFEQADFVEDTDPRFFDAQGDQPYELLVETLPVDGTLTLRGVPVVAGQILSFENDINTEDFKFVPDVTKTVPGVSFKFNVSDTGSKQFP